LLQACLRNSQFRFIDWEVSYVPLCERFALAQRHIRVFGVAGRHLGAYPVRL